MASATKWSIALLVICVLHYRKFLIFSLFAASLYDTFNAKTIIIVRISFVC